MPNNTRKKILIVTSSFPRWVDDDVTGRFMLEIACELQKKFEVYVIAPHTKGSLKSEIMKEIKIVRHKQSPFGIEFAYGSGLLPNIRNNPWKVVFLPFYFIYQFIEIARLVNQYKIDFINPHWLIPQGTISVLYKKLFNKNIKIITTVHGTDINSLNFKFANWLKGWTLKGTDAVIAVNALLESKVRNFGYQGEITVTPMGVDTEKFNKNRFLNKTQETTFTIIYIGALLKTKGIIELLHSIPIVLKEISDIKLQLIGDGELFGDIKNYIQQNQLDSKIELLGVKNHNEIPEYLAHADLFVLPSYAEGFSVCVAEAMSTSLPVLMTRDIGIQNSIQKLLQPGTINPIYPLNQINADEIAKNIIQILRNPDPLRIREGREIIEKNFSWKVLGQKALEVFIKAQSA